MKLTNQNIWIISPQEWDHILISKHYYALELASRNNKIFFINPPSFSFRKKIKIKINSNNLQIISFYLFSPSWIKFKIPFLYDYLVKKKFVSLLKTTKSPDILWNFDNFIYFKFEYLFNCFKIFQPVDSFNSQKLNKHIQNYSVVFSLSNLILNSIDHPKKYFINHGLNSIFEKLAKARINLLKNSNQENYGLTKKIGYVGNISIHSIDHTILLENIKYFSNFKFCFYGPFNDSDQNIKNLVKLPNVKLNGVKYGEELYSSLLECDILMICYKTGNFYFGDNSHKILEYLSTGKTIVSSYISNYHGNDLIEMNYYSDNRNLHEVFAKTISRLETLNSNHMQIKRIEFALDNTYEKQINRIEEIINMIECNK